MLDSHGPTVGTAHGGEIPNRLAAERKTDSVALSQQRFKNGGNSCILVARQT